MIWQNITTKNLNKKNEDFSEAEWRIAKKIVWLHLRRKQFGYRFLRQYSVDHFVIDFYCPELKLAVEMDGDVHNLPEQKEYDIARQKYLEKFGIKFIRIKNEEFLGNPNKAFSKIEKEISSSVKRQNRKS